MSGLRLPTREVNPSSDATSSQGGRHVMGHVVLPLKITANTPRNYGIVFDNVANDSAPDTFSAIGCTQNGEVVIKNRYDDPLSISSGLLADPIFSNQQNANLATLISGHFMFLGAAKIMSPVIELQASVGLTLYFEVEFDEQSTFTSSRHLGYLLTSTISGTIALSVTSMIGTRRVAISSGSLVVPASGNYMISGSYIA